MKFPVKDINHAVSHYSGRGPIFGGDIIIADACNKREESSECLSYFPSSYQFTKPREMAKDLLAGHMKFHVLDYEVFGLGMSGVLCEMRECCVNECVLKCMVCL